MKRTPAVLALTLLLGSAPLAFAQAPASADGPAKGNAPAKSVHTVNDGAAKPASNSFTEGQARQHILNSGYGSVSGLAKGDDGIWRGTAVKGGAPVAVALDFKGNVTEGGAAGSVRGVGPTPGAGPRAYDPAADGRSDRAVREGRGRRTQATSASGAGHRTTHARHRAHAKRHGHGHCASGRRTGVACSGIDRNHNGVSDREDHSRAETRR